MFVQNEESPKIKIPVGVLFLVSILLLTPFILAYQHYPVVKHFNHSYNHPIYPTADLQIPSGTVTTDLHSRFILSYMMNIFAASSFTMVTNHYSKYTNGNRRGQGIKISAWNKGGGFLQNKMPEIKNLVNGLHPHVLGISEANLHKCK